MDQGNERPGAVILGGSFHSLGAARNLAKYRVPVCIMEGGNCVSRFSKAVSCFLICPVIDDEDAYVEFILSMAQDKGMEGWVLFPSTDETVRILAQQRDRLKKRFRVTTQSWDIINYLYDKRLTYQLAKARKVPSPETWMPGSVDELEDLDLVFPVVVKPAISKCFMAATKKKAYRANDMAELLDTYKLASCIIDRSEILIQELIPGRAENLYSYVGLFENGTPLAGLAARRPRQHPMEFGRASTYVEVVIAPELEILSTRLLQSIGYSGLAEVEFMYDTRDRQFKFLEVNARIWGWHTIAIQAGLDLPYLAYSTALGHAVNAEAVRDDAKWVRLVTDIPTAIPEIAAGRLTIRQYLESLSGNLSFAVLSFRDPLPFIADAVLAPYNYVRGRGF